MTGDRVFPPDYLTDQPAERIARAAVRLREFILDKELAPNTNAVRMLIELQTELARRGGDNDAKGA